MQKMEIRRTKGENGYNYTLKKDDKSLNIESYNIHKNTMIRVSLETVTNLKYVINKEDPVYNIFNSFYIVQSELKEPNQEVYGITIRMGEDESYILDMTKCHGVVIMKNPTNGWIKMFRDLQKIIPENELEQRKSKSKVKRLFNV